ncbi:pyrophosphate--fructose 6-phosphate 1-phosphotransferase subunit beta [Chlorella sorokiniana]|uniref:Pyrophosphate--fructose 6-phosphate 1-phosphotransferase subunit beta n=1 Tax=Chlorella sorokiniana TaxID=3076 RepID=A0A2P6TRR0_CHLSO|nr:pyrophosphate--fructose 6-phosphate 1-phosphotransferase subunit beta [Chlorella sorokiniana]|eukprot:PRW56738.1 pyrophosphate--fructose 6-phosphate 1-phosphotransferase subunit beta [Chlorella sorokiniana]
MAAAAAADHTSEWVVPPSDDGWVLSHDALRLDMDDLQRLLDALSTQVAAGRPLEKWQLEAAQGECDAKFDAAAADPGAAAQQLGSLKASFEQFKKLCTAHYREEEVDTLPLIRRHFTSEEVRPTAKKISKAYGLMDMGNYLRPMTPEHRTAWMTRVKMPLPVQWIMALQVWRYHRAVVEPGNIGSGAGLLQGLGPPPKQFTGSELSLERAKYRPVLPAVLAGPHAVREGESRDCCGDHELICGLFPHLCGTSNGHTPLKMVHLTAAAPAGPEDGPPGRPLQLGVVLSGGQASGGHNVIIGLHDYLQRWHPGSTLVGFLGGPAGVMNNRYKVLTADELDGYRNQGGFHLIGSGRDKIEKADQLEAAARACAQHNLDGIVIIGGDDSNTNAAVMAEHFLAHGIKTRVVGVPKTIDGDLKNADVPISFGFDTACKVFSESIGNIAIDAMSAKKYYHFIKLMGRAASHVTLECALQTHPQVALICEEVEANRWGLKGVVRQVADVIAQRAAEGRNYGVVLIPEGLVEHVHDVSTLIAELNELLAQGVNAVDEETIAASLTPESAEVFAQLPPGIRGELLQERDPHGNVQVSHIETEKLIIKAVATELARRKVAGTYKGKFAALAHFFGYEGRCSLPSNFDATYCNALGQAAGALVAGNQTGVMATVSELQLPASQWTVGGTPLLSMMHLERRAGRDKPVIKKALVELEGPAFKAFTAWRGQWAAKDCVRSPGPIQFDSSSFGDLACISLALERNAGVPILIKGWAGGDAGVAMREE